MKYAIEINGKQFVTSDINAIIQAMAAGTPTIIATAQFPKHMFFLGGEAWIPAPDKSPKELELN